MAVIRHGKVHLPPLYSQPLYAQSLYSNLYTATTSIFDKVTIQQSLNRDKVYTTATSKFDKVYIDHLYIPTKSQWTNSIQRPTLNGQTLTLYNLYTATTSIFDKVTILRSLNRAKVVALLQ